MIASFHHLPDEKTRLAQLKKTFKEMKSGARIIMVNWNLESDWAKAKFKKDWEKIDENDFLIPWKSKDGAIIVQRYYHHFEKQEIEDLVTKIGFTIEKLAFATNGEWSDKKAGKNLVLIAKKP